MNSIVSEKRYIQQALGIPYENLSQSYLRAETTLGSNSQYAFTLQANKKSSPVVTERLLNLNDQFVITHFRVGLKFLTGTSGFTDTDELNAIVQTYLDPAIFTGDLVNAAGVYNSSLEFTIDRKQYLPEFPVSSFYRVPDTQTDSPSEGGAAAIVNAYDNGLYGFYPSEPTLIDGRQTLDINLVMGSAVDITDANNTARVVFETRGYLVVNSKS
jgi:hypothetical protein